MAKLTPKTGRDNPLYVRDCDLCGCPLGFGEVSGSGGGIVPLDLRSSVYAMVFEKSPGHETTVVRTTLCYVSHNFTCKKKV